MTMRGEPANGGTTRFSSIITVAAVLLLRLLWLPASELREFGAGGRMMLPRWDWERRCTLEK